MDKEKSKAILIPDPAQWANPQGRAARAVALPTGSTGLREAPAHPLRGRQPCPASAAGPAACWGLTRMFRRL